MTERDHLDVTLPYGQVRDAFLRMRPSREPRLVFDGETIAPDVEKRFAPRPPVARPVATAPPGTVLPSARAPRHAPRIRIASDVHPVAELAECVELFGASYLARIFTPFEREQCGGPGEIDRLAGRFAAKEAVLKVLDLHGTTVVPWQSVEVRAGRNGVPYVVLSGRVAAVAEAQGLARVDISLSHDTGMAMAVAAAIPSA